MGAVTYLTDRLSNLVANLGTPRDKAYHTTYGAAPLTDEQLVNAYRYAWLPRKIVDVPAMDATRQWRAWSVDADEAASIEAREKELGLRRKTTEAMKKARLFGGSAIYIGTADANLAQPIRESSRIRYLTVLTPRQISSTEVEQRPESPNFGEPTMFAIAGGVHVHPSRVAIFRGAELPDEDIGAVRDVAFGDSVLAATMEAIKQADGTGANIASLVYEAQIDVIKIPNLMAGMTDPEYEKRVLERLQLAMKAKSINGALLLDAEEEYEQKSASFANLKDLLMAFLQVVSGASNVPATRLLGVSPGGLNATGDSDMRNYYDYLSSLQEDTIGPALANIDRLIAPEAAYEWNSLWQSTPQEEAELRHKTADTLLKLSQSALVPEDDLSTAAVALLTEQGVLPDAEAVLDGEQMRGAPDDG